MKDLIKAILSHIPKYISNFSGMFSGPKTFIASRDMGREGALAEALTFVGISFCILMLLSAPLIPERVDFWEHFSSVFILSLILIVSAAAVLCVSWKIVGGKVEFEKFLITYSYYFGVVVPLIAIILLFSDGVLKSFDRELYDTLVAINSNQATNVECVYPFQSTALIVSLGIKFIGLILITIWAFIAWGAYRELNQLSKAKSFWAMMINGILDIPVLIIYFFLARILIK